jgi:hypothetical protein
MRKILYSTAVIAGFLLASCAAPQAAQPQVKLQEFDRESEENGKAFADRFASGFAAAVKSGEFAQWQNTMPEHIKARVSAGSFAKMRAELQEMFGNLQNFTYLSSLQNRNLRDHLWVMRFEKAGEIREVMFLVRVFRNDRGVPEISGFGVKRF